MLAEDQPQVPLGDEHPAQALVAGIPRRRIMLACQRNRVRGKMIRRSWWI